MITEFLKTTEDLYRQSIVKSAEILRKGGIVAIPTETVYGLAASALDSDALKKVFEAKGRPQDNPLIVHISSMEMLREIAKDIPEKARLCAEKFWPGPFKGSRKRSSRIRRDALRSGALGRWYPYKCSHSKSPNQKAKRPGAPNGIW